MIINKRILRIINEHKVTYIGMLVLIALATCTFIGLKTATTSIKESVNQNRISANVEDANFRIESNLTSNDISMLEQKFDLTIEIGSEKELEYNGAILRIRPIFEKINKPSLYLGRMLDNSSEIMVDRFFYDVQKLSINQQIVLNETSYKITGIFTTPDYLGLLKSKTDFMADGSKFGLILVSKSDFEKIDCEKSLIRYMVKYNKDNGDYFRKYINSNYKVIEWTNKTNNIRIDTFDGEIEGIISIGEIAPIFILIVSSFIMATVLNRLLKKEYTYIGTLTGLGYKKRYIYIHYLRIPLLISAVGGLIGVILGILLVEPFSLVSSVEYNIPKVIYNFKWNDLLFAFLLPLILNLFSSIIAINKAFKLNIVSLLKSSGSSKRKSIFLKIIPYRKGSFSLRFKAKELATNAPRSVVMIIGIMVSAMFILSGFMFNSTIEFLYKSNFHELFGYKYQYVLKNPTISNQSAGEPYMLSKFDYEKGNETINITIIGVTPSTKYIKLYDINNNLIDENKTTITRSVAKRLNVNIGDTIIVKSNSNLKEYEITIDAISDIAYSENVYMPIDKLNKMLNLPNDAYNGLYSNTPLKINDDLLLDVLSSEDSKAGISTAIGVFKSLLYILGVIASIIGIVVIYIITILIVEENRKNISMLKVVGYSNKEIEKLVLKSTSILVYIGFILGIPFAYFVIQSFLDEITLKMFFDFNVKLNMIHILLSFILILITYYFTLFLTKYKILKINMSEILKARE